MKTKKRFLSILLSLVMVLGLMPGMSLTVQAASAVNVKIVTTNSGSSWTIAGSTTLPQDYTVVALMPMMGWDQDSYNIQVNGTNAQIKSGSGKDMVITISDKGTFTIEVNYDYYGMPMTKNATVSVTELVAAHTHTWAIAWSHDATYHWHACTGEGASDACLNETGAAKAEHTYGDTGDARFTCTVCEYVDTVKQAASGLADAKTTATATVNGVNSDDYIAADQQTVTDAKSTALNAINTATTEAEVTTALTNFNNAIAGCTTQAAADLATAKTNATATVNAVNASDYIEADQQTVTDAKSTALNAINAATTEADVTTALNNFNTAIAGCTTQAADLATAKAAAKAALDKLLQEKKESDYDAEDWAALTKAIADAKAAIDKAAATGDVTKAKDDAVSAVNAIKTKAQKAAETPADPKTSELPDEASQEKIILAQKGAQDVKNSIFHKLQAKQKKAKKKSISISWKRVSGAKKYVVYGSLYGKKMKKLKTLSGTSYTKKKLKPGKTYKFIVAAYGGGKALATSKTIFIATAGGKIGNPTAVKVNKTLVRLKAKKTFKLRATMKNKKPVKRYRKISYESSKPTVAKVSKTGKIKGLKKGTCYVYAYAQNGLFKKVKVSVR